jgi:hypothetical protein
VEIKCLFFITLEVSFGEVVGVFFTEKTLIIRYPRERQMLGQRLMRAGVLMQHTVLHQRIRRFGIGHGRESGR